MKTNLLPPFKAKVVEPIYLLSREDREKRIEAAGLNVFRLKSHDVTIDLLTDSGTGAVSSHQLSKMMLGDESYAGSQSFLTLEAQVRETFRLPYMLPVHQGRAAEKILNTIMIKPNQLVPGNSHFDTTKAHIEFAGGRCLDLTIDEGKSSSAQHPFKGNINIEKLIMTFEKYGPKAIGYVLITVTCNSGGGQPVSMENIREVSRLCKKAGVPLFLDAARFAENAWFIKRRESEFAQKSIQEIVWEMFSYADGFTMSSKKDAISPMGGLLVVRDEQLFENLKTPTILFEGFVTYGGLSGLMMEALAQGLREVVDDNYLSYRIGQVSMLADMLREREIPVVEPSGGHAVFIDARKFFPRVPEDQFPAQMLCVEMYREGGVRPVEVGSCLAGRDPDTGVNVRPALDLCRLTIPRRVYFSEHLEYVAETALEVRRKYWNRSTGLRFDKEAAGIRHFDSTFKYI
jgi:tryptophanase